MFFGRKLSWLQFLSRFSSVVLDLELSARAADLSKAVVRHWPAAVFGQKEVSSSGTQSTGNLGKSWTLGGPSKAMSESLVET